MCAFSLHALHAENSSYYSTVPLIIRHVQCSVFFCQVCFSLNTHIRHCISASGHHGSSYGLSWDLVEQCRVAHEQHVFIYENSDMNYSSLFQTKRAHCFCILNNTYTLSCFIDTRTGSMPVNIVIMCTDRTSPHHIGRDVLYTIWEGKEKGQHYFQICQGGAYFTWCPN